MATRPSAPFASMLGILTGVGEETRLRLVALLAEAELTVTELVAILGQSQPRVSRHLKLLIDAGLIERHREGAWAFFRLTGGGVGGTICHAVIAAIDPADPVLAGDRLRLEETRRARARQASRYFTLHASEWDRIRSLHVPEERVEAAILAVAGSERLHAVLDLGTGTGRMLELFAALAQRCVGVDQSPAMLGVARARLDRLNLRNVQLRQGDIYALPVERDGFDLVLLHQVLHYLDDPARALREAIRALRPGGRIVIADFAPHGEEFLREQHAHRRLGFGSSEIADILEEAGLDVGEPQLLAPDAQEPGQLIVTLWVARDRRIQSDALPLTQREVA